MISSQFSFCLSLLIGTALCAAPPVRAAGAETAPPLEPLTLDGAMAEALARHPAFRVVDADVDVARGEVVTAQTRPGLELALSPSLRRLNDSDGASYEFLGAIGLSRTFLFPGKRELLVALAERNVALRRQAAAGLQFQLAAAVRQAFARLLAAQHLIGLRREQLDSAQLFQQATARRVEGGYASDFEAVKSEGDVVNARKLLAAAEGQIASARVELNALLGREFAAPLTVEGEWFEPAPEPPLETLIATALAENPSLRVQALAAEIAGLKVRQARLARRPDLTAGPVVEVSRTEQIVGFSLSVPLPSRDAGRGELLTATAEQRRIAAETERLRREIASAVATAAAQLAAARAEAAVYTPAYLAHLRAVVAQAERGYAQSATSLLIHLEARRTYFEALADAYNAQAEVATARAALEAALGAPLSSVSPNSHR